MWKDKTCELCMYNIDTRCRKFPISTTEWEIVSYLRTYIIEHTVNEGVRMTSSKACAEYKESN